MTRITPRFFFALSACALLLSPAVSQAALTFPIVVDFDLDDNGVALQNGQAIDTEFFTFFTITSDAGDLASADVFNPNDTNPGDNSFGDGITHLGPTIFDTSDPGPNSSGSDMDLLVNTGNALILQNSAFSTQTVPGFFDVPNDEAEQGDLGFVQFNFTTRVELESIDLIDINGGVEIDVTLTDINGETRLYEVPEMWTNDIAVSGPLGFGTLLLNTLADQDAEGPGGVAVASQTAGFDQAQVVTLRVDFGGNNPSGALDNLKIAALPEPTAAMLTALAGLFALGRRRV